MGKTCIEVLPALGPPGRTIRQTPEKAKTMTTRSLRIVAATALSMALAVSTTAFAEGNRDGKGHSGHAKVDQNRDGVITQNEVPAKRWERLKQADANKDGKITRDELTAFFKTKSPAHFKTADKNGDGALSQNEVPAKRWEHLKQADANKDGKVTKDELAASFESRKQAHFKKADKNGDGALSQNEVPAKRWERLKQADANKDSKVTKDELTTFFKAKRPQGRQGKPGNGPHS